jgi:hypothetical protein
VLLKKSPDQHIKLPELETLLPTHEELFDHQDDDEGVEPFISPYLVLRL